MLIRMREPELRKAILQYALRNFKDVCIDEESITLSKSDWGNQFDVTFEAESKE